MAKKRSKTSAPHTDQISVVNLLYEPASIAPGMDVERIHDVIRSAEGGDTRDLFALYRDIVVSDSHLQGEFSKRKLAVLGDQMSITPADEDVPEDVESADLVRAQVEDCDSWMVGCAHLLDSCLLPVSVVEKVFAATGNARRPFTLDRLVPVPGHWLDFSKGHLRIYDVDPVTGAMLPTSHKPDPARYIVHRGHMLSVPDNWGGPMRSILFWWLLSTMDREWWTRYLDRYGSPFLVGTYPRGDKDARSTLERAFSLAVKLGGLAVSDGTRVEIKEAASSSSGDSFERFLAICQREKSKLVLGQTLSAEAQPTGLGSGVSKQQEAVRQDVRQFDSRMLTRTLRDQLFAQIVEVNGLSGRAPRATWGADSSEETMATVALLRSLWEAGLEVEDDSLDDLSRRVGLTLRRSTVPSLPPGTMPPSPFTVPHLRA